MNLVKRDRPKSSLKPTQSKPRHSQMPHSTREIETRPGQPARTPPPTFLLLPIQLSNNTARPKARRQHKSPQKQQPKPSPPKTLTPKDNPTPPPQTRAKKLAPNSRENNSEGSKAPPSMTNVYETTPNQVNTEISRIVILAERASMPGAIRKGVEARPRRIAG
jgi:hypothetical protein